MAEIMTLYHGSSQIVSAPKFGKGREHNDFGLGFYCTEQVELAKEWAVSSLANGFSNKYALDAEYLKVLNLNSSEWTILNWIAVLLQHRVFPIKTPVARKARQHLIDNFCVNVNAYDLVITEANEAYMKMLEEDDDGIFVNDIVKGAIRSDDPRIPGNLPQ